VRRRSLREFAAELLSGTYADSEVPPPPWVREAVARRPGNNVLSPEQFRTLRAAVRRRILSSSYELVAEETGVPPGVLRHALRGHRPQKRYLALLERWYRDAVLAGDVELSDRGAVLVLKPFLRLIPCDEHDRAASELIASMRQLYIRHGWAVPEWVAAGCGTLGVAVLGRGRQNATVASPR
jgi:hypothetical protein